MTPIERTRSLLLAGAARSPARPRVLMPMPAKAEERRKWRRLRVPVARGVELSGWVGFIVLISYEAGMAGVSKMREKFVDGLGILLLRVCFESGTRA